MNRNSSVPATLVPEDARIRFAQLRRDVATVASETLTIELGFAVSIAEISDAAAAEASCWYYEDDRSEHVPGWSWTDQVRRYRRRPRRVDAAFYINSDIGTRLWGLILGRISNSRVVASIHFIERDPGQATGRAFVDATSRYMQFLAAAARCPIYSINRPHPELVEYYRDKGYKRELTRGSRLIRLEQDLPHDMLHAAGLDASGQT
ncbi:MULTISPECIES: hypothetical protein [unclassified Paraburkholderia]|uniref:hypothetical protein n=1 Tax=unclassified Paraburkholderia TaxID=2615204 RepID=UPI002AB2A1EE|nr:MULTISPECIES: hypothetical protein [unclassified Paraburkholderia]